MKNTNYTILFDANSLMGRRTGVGYYTSHLLENLAKQYPETHFVGYYYNFLKRKQPPHGPYAPNISYRAVYHFPGPIINLLRRFRIEVPIELLTFTHTDFILYPNFLNQPSIFRTPCATVIHDLTFVDLPEYVARKNLDDLRRFIPNHIRRSQFIMTVSNFAKQRIHDTFDTPLEKIVVTPIPPELPASIDKKKQKAELDKLGVTGKYFLTLSTVEPRKNVLSMVDAFLLLPEKLQEQYTFVITGMIGWNCEAEVARLQQVAQQGKNILHLGYVTEEQRAVLYNNAVFYTSASHYEGFGMTPLEAMSYSKACALSDISVFKEVAGNTALYFNQTKSDSIAQTWTELLTNKKYRDTLGDAAKLHASTYHWQDIAADVYGRIISTIKGPRHHE